MWELRCFSRSQRKTSEVSTLCLSTGSTTNHGAGLTASKSQCFPLNLFPTVLRLQLPAWLFWLYVFMRVLGVQTQVLTLVRPSFLATEPSSLQPRDSLYIEVCGTHSNPSEARLPLALWHQLGKAKLKREELHGVRFRKGFSQIFQLRFFRSTLGKDVSMRGMNLSCHIRWKIS